jgi:hypothetical protein
MIKVRENIDNLEEQLLFLENKYVQISIYYQDLKTYNIRLVDENQEIYIEETNGKKTKIEETFDAFEQSGALKSTLIEALRKNPLKLSSRVLFQFYHDRGDKVLEEEYMKDFNETLRSFFEERNVHIFIPNYQDMVTVSENPTLKETLSPEYPTSEGKMNEEEQINDPVITSTLEKAPLRDEDLNDKQEEDAIWNVPNIGGMSRCESYAIEQSKEENLDYKAKNIEQPSQFNFSYEPRNNAFYESTIDIEYMSQYPF